MSIPEAVREQVRQRAGFACEYYGATETDTAGQLTLDHFRPRAKGGSDAPGNLVYCCHRCNEYKSDYWPQTPDAQALWNPRQEAAQNHFLELADGSLHALDATGELTLSRLRLNRPALIAHRLQQRQSREEQRLLTRLHDMVALFGQGQRQQTILLQEHRDLLQQQLRVMQALLNRKPGDE